MSGTCTLAALLEQADTLAAALTCIPADDPAALSRLLPQLVAFAEQWAAAAEHDPEAKAGRITLEAVLGDASKALGRKEAGRLFTDAAVRLRQAAREARDAAAQQHAEARAAVRAAKEAEKVEAAAKRAQLAAERVVLSDEALAAPPFILKGWDRPRKLIHYQHRETGQLGSISPPNGSGPSGLLALAPIAWWEAAYPNPDGRPGVRWPDACSSVIEAANTCPVFRPESIRGRGVWLDDGRVAWNLGDRLLVDGQPCRLLDLETAHAYALAPPLPAIEHGPPLTDRQGAAITKAVQAIGWEEPLAYLLVLGWLVVASVGGALVHRPGLQLTAPRGAGKSTTISRVFLPLLGGLTEKLSEVTAAAIRQRARGDTLPVLIDESEQGDHGGRTRAGHLHLLRCSYDGDPGGRGTTHGEAVEQLVRYSVALAGINATVSNAADRSRVAVVTRKHLPTSEWQQVEAQLDSAVTVEAGRALIRRTVANLHTLMANARTLAKAIERAGDEARAGDCYGTLLAGAHLLTSTDRLTPETAAAWLQGVGWKGAEDAADEDAADEGRQCLETILAARVAWRGEADPAGVITAWELAEAEMGRNGHRPPIAAGEEAAKALGRHGLKVLPEGGAWMVAFANDSPGLLALLARTPWANGGHRQHLLNLPGAQSTGRNRKLRVPADPVTRRAVLVPVATIEGVAEQASGAAAAG